MAQTNSMSAPGRALASVVEPIRVVSESELSFGRIEKGQDGSFAVLPNESNQPDGRYPAKFRIIGSANRGYQFFVQSQVQAIGDRTGETVAVTDFTVTSENSGATDWSGELDSAGRDTVFLGGTMKPSSDTPEDWYRADVTIQVSYD